MDVTLNLVDFSFWAGTQAPVGKAQQANIVLTNHGSVALAFEVVVPVSAKYVLLATPQRGIIGTGSHHHRHA